MIRYLLRYSLELTSTFNLSDPQFSSSFGFTETEVMELMMKSKIPVTTTADIRRWYGSYQAVMKGRKRTRIPISLYNPWSIVQFFSQLQFGAYCESDGRDASLDLVRLGKSSDYYTREIVGLMSDFRLGGNGVDRRLNLDLSSFSSTNESYCINILSLLYFTGYLTAVMLLPTAFQGYQVDYLVSIPNLETYPFFEELLYSWIKLALEKGHGEPIVDFQKYKNCFHGIKIDDLQTIINGITQLYAIDRDRMYQVYENVLQSIVSFFCFLADRKYTLTWEGYFIFKGIHSVFYPLPSSTKTTVVAQVFKILQGTRRRKVEIQKKLDEVVLERKYFEDIINKYEKSPEFHHFTEIEVRVIVALTGTAASKKVDFKHAIHRFTMEEARAVLSYFKEKENRREEEDNDRR
jgi:hypothetical protein